MTAEVYRNHVSVIVSRTVTALILGIFMVSSLNNIMFGSEDVLPAYAAEAGVLAVLLGPINWRLWKLTTFTFADEEIIVRRDTVWKRKAEIRYERIASVNAIRTVWNRIFGTTTLQFNINSSVRAGSPEVRLVLSIGEADRLRAISEDRMYRGRKEGPGTGEDADVREESFIKVSNSDIILHSVIGQPTAPFLISAAFLVYGVWGIFADNGGNMLIGLFMFAALQGISVAKSILGYWNFCVYRSGDQITVRCGMVTTRRNSFRIQKVNAVRLRAPLFARFAGRCTLEAEVVGTMMDNGSAPLLCPVMKREEVCALFGRLFPEFRLEGEQERQSGRCLLAMLLRTLPLAAAWAGICMYIPTGHGVVTDAVNAIGVVGAAVMVMYAYSGYKVRTILLGDGIFMMSTGGFDRSEQYLPYDLVQYTSVVSGPIQRMFGLSRLKVRLLSSKGAIGITSGMFPPAELEKVPESVMGRISDGGYDYRRYL